MRINRESFSSALVLAGFFFVGTVRSEEPAAVPERIVVAHTAYLEAVAANQQPKPVNPMSEAADIKPVAQAEFAKAVRKWGRFQIIEDVSKADLVLVVVEWEDHHRWGNTIVCRDQLFIFDGGSLPSGESMPVWKGDPEKWGKFGGCSGAGEPIKELRKLMGKSAKAKR
jgi:hypothetical protein